jgi:polyisoprenoid-binding protein YceI
MHLNCRIVRTAIILLAIVGPVLAASEAESDPVSRVYFVDPTHSSIQFSVPFMGIARVSGQFDQFFGSVEHNEKDLRLSRADIVTRAASLDTRNARRDKDLRSADYFDASAFPEIQVKAPPPA